MIRSFNGSPCDRVSISLFRVIVESVAGTDNDKPRVVKLGVKRGSRASLLNVTDASIERELLAAGADVSRRARARSDLILLQVDAASHLASRVARAAASLAPAGALWVVRPRPGAPGLGERDVMAAAKAAGLVDVKVVRFSETHSALKCVVPLARRG
jgi:hypothetical protein